MSHDILVAGDRSFGEDSSGFFLRAGDDFNADRSRQINGNGRESSNVGHSVLDSSLNSTSRTDHSNSMSLPDSRDPNSNSNSYQSTSIHSASTYDEGGPVSLTISAADIDRIRSLTQNIGIIDMDATSRERGGTDWLRSTYANDFEAERRRLRRSQEERMIREQLEMAQREREQAQSGIPTILPNAIPTISGESTHSIGGYGEPNDANEGRYYNRAGHTERDLLGEYDNDDDDDNEGGDGYDQRRETGAGNYGLGDNSQDGEDDDDGNNNINGHDDDEDEDEEEDDNDDDEEDEGVSGSRDAGDDLDVSNMAMYKSGLKKFESLGLVDIGKLAWWRLSSFKTGYGIKELREDSPYNYWQSDGVQPHYIQVHFTKKVSIEKISFFLNYPTDESYTPSKIVIFAGSGEHDLLEVASKEFIEPIGWQNIYFKDVRADNILKTYFIKICFIANHQNGKDTHVRGLKIFAPSTKNDVRQDMDDEGVSFTSIKLLSECAIR